MRSSIKRAALIGIGAAAMAGKKVGKALDKAGVTKKRILKVAKKEYKRAGRILEKAGKKRINSIKSRVMKKGKSAAKKAYNKLRKVRNELVRRSLRAKI